MAQYTFFSSKKTLNIRGNTVVIDRPLVMGIVNVTPDSFYKESRYNAESEVISSATKMIEEGVTFLDIGGYSSRPGANDIEVSEELNRVIPAIENIRSQFSDVFISVDTFRSNVAEAALNAGADIINDISGGELDPKMFDLITESNVPYILMNMKGTPQTMKGLATYDNMLLEILDYFQRKIDILKNKGHNDLIIDPGFGFSKTISQNFELLCKLNSLKVLQLPILAGLSRKSMVYKSLDIEAEDALNGTTALNMLALHNGASILRVHDVKEAVEAIKLFNLTYIN